MKIGIIGAGTMGLTIAYRLSQKGHHVHLIESAAKIGGLSTWFDYEDFTWDKYYHVILRTDSHLIGLIEELDLKDKLVWKATKTGFLWKKQLVSLSNYREFLQFPVLNPIEKFRLAAGILWSRYVSRPERLEKIPAGKWLSQVFGRAVFEKIWEPLLTAKFGMLKDKVPATIIHSTLNRYSSTRSTKDGREWMGHLAGAGLKTLFTALKEKIEAAGGTIRCNARVTAIDDSGGGVVISTPTGEERFDQVISTIPTLLLQRIAPNLRFTTPLSTPPLFLGVIRLALVLKKSFSPYYVTNIIDKGFPFTGIIEVSQCLQEDELNGYKLMMLPRYDVPESEWFEKSDEEVQSTFMNHIKQVWPSIDNEVVRTYVHREKVVQALWVDSPPMLAAPPMTEQGNLFSVNAELAGRDTLNNNALIGVANRITREYF